jgi:hypothetical protein
MQVARETEEAAALQERPMGLVSGARHQRVGI